MAAVGTAQAEAFRSYPLNPPEGLMTEDMAKPIPVEAADGLWWKKV